MFNVHHNLCSPKRGNERMRIKWSEWVCNFKKPYLFWRWTNIVFIYTTRIKESLDFKGCLILMKILIISCYTRITLRLKAEALASPSEISFDNLLVQYLKMPKKGRKKNMQPILWKFSRCINCRLCWNTIKIIILKS